MILAAGFGTRMHPLTLNKPKSLIPVVNRPSIEYSLALLRCAGVREVGVNLHYLGEQIRTELGDGAKFGVSIFYSNEEKILGTGGAVMRMKPFLGRESFFLLNADVVCGVNLKQVLQFHRSLGAAATMVVRPLPPKSSFSRLGIDKAGHLVSYKNERKKAQGFVQEYMFCGVHVLDPVVFDFLPQKGFSCINNDGYTAMLRRGMIIGGYVYKGPWFDLGTPVRYLDANCSLVSGRACVPQFDPFFHTSFPNAVLVADTVEIEQDVELGPEVVIGKGCRIKQGSRISHSVLWPHTMIAKNSLLDYSIVAGKNILNVQLPKYMKFRDSEFSTVAK
jgi:NDP-sugar pyrophosphorylase family protein